MNYKNESGYEILCPWTIPDQVENLLNDNTKIYMGLSEESTPDDAFRSLYLLNVLQGKSAIKITLQDQNGIKLKGVIITSSQFCDGKGNKVNQAITDDNGEINTFSDAETTNVAISNYFEIENANTSYSTPLGEQHEFTWTVNSRENLTLTSSGNYRLSKNVTSFDACCIGGGGGGGGGSYYDDRVSGGCGGGGGYLNNLFAQNAVNNSFYNCNVGGAGAGLKKASNRWHFEDKAGNGGNSSIVLNSESILTANGGEGGYSGGPGAQNIVAQGNGNGAVSHWKSHGGTGDTVAGSAATNGTGYVFNDSGLGMAGGGGGAGLSDVSGVINYSAKGNPYGGQGANSVEHEKPSGYGGGGGGGMSSRDSEHSTSDGDSGYQGAIYIRWTINP